MHLKGFNKQIDFSLSGNGRNREDQGLSRMIAAARIVYRVEREQLQELQSGRRRDFIDLGPTRRDVEDLCSSTASQLGGIERRATCSTTVHGGKCVVEFD